MAFPNGIGTGNWKWWHWAEKARGVLSEGANVTSLADHSGVSGTAALDAVATAAVFRSGGWYGRAAYEFANTAYVLPTLLDGLGANLLIGDGNGGAAPREYTIVFAGLCLPSLAEAAGYVVSGSEFTGDVDIDSEPGDGRGPTFSYYDSGSGDYRVEQDLETKAGLAGTEIAFYGNTPLKGRPTVIVWVVKLSNSTASARVVQTVAQLGGGGIITQTQTLIHAIGTGQTDSTFAVKIGAAKHRTSTTPALVRKFVGMYHFLGFADHAFDSTDIAYCCNNLLLTPVTTMAPAFTETFTDAANTDLHAHNAAWVYGQGTWKINASNKGTSSSQGNTDVAYVDVGKADGLLTCDLQSWYTGGGDLSFAELNLRYVGSGDHYALRMAPTVGADLYLDTGGSFGSSLANSTNTITSGTTYNVAMAVYGPCMDLYVGANPTMWFHYTGATTAQTSTKFGLRLGYTDSVLGDATWDNFVFATESAFATAYTLTTAPGSFVLTGKAAGLSSARKLTTSPGTFTLTGIASALSSTRKLTTAPGSFTLTGQAAGLSKGNRLTTAPGAFTLTGQPSVLTSARRLTTVAGSFLLAGQAAGLTFTLLPVPMPPRVSGKRWQPKVRSLTWLAERPKSGGS